ncbi:MAG: FAD-dependent oxidoreductase [Rhodobacteraceae bacterium]|nr:FAD-dependent oxidoreductase [Paracoccaceae bacterium]
MTMGETSASDARFSPAGPGRDIPPEFRRLLSPLRIGAITVRNRALSTGHGTGFMEITEGGRVGPRSVEYHRARAAGGIGLIVFGTISADGTPIGIVAGAGQHKGADDVVEAEYRALVDAVHAEGGKIFCLVSHSGSVTSMGAQGEPPLAPSPIPMDRTRDVPHELEVDEIAAIVAAFARTAARCRRGGFDGVELSFTHGNLVQQFLSPRSNRRRDAYGGSEENRLRFAREVLEATRAAVGPDYVLGIRYSATEIEPDGYGLEDGVRYARMMVGWGKLDFVDVSAGTNNSMRSRAIHYPTMASPPRPLVPYARAIREAVDVPVFCVGKISNPHEAEAILAAGDADLVGMTRAHIAEPAIIRKLTEGRLEDIRTCIHCCEGCFGRQQRVGDITCIYNPRTGREHQWKRLAPTEDFRSVLVIGGGPAGLEAARVAAKRGHDVVLHERADVLGGQVRTLLRTPYRQDYGLIVDWLERQARRKGVLMRLESEMTADKVLAANADVVIVATGSRDTRPDLPGAGGANVFTAREVLRGARPGRRVVIGDFDGRHMGLSTAELLAQRGHAVEIVTTAFYVGQDVDLLTWRATYDRLQQLGVTMTPLHRIVAITAGGVRIASTAGEEREIAADSVVVCSKGTAERDLYRALKGKVGRLYAIGDCWAPRHIEQAIFEGARTGREV